MKTITRSVLVAFFVCGGVLSASAQTAEQREYIRRNTDLATVKELAERFDSEFKKNYQRALELARQNSWPLTINEPNGGFSELVGVDENDQPKYYTTSNAGSARTSRVDRINTGGSAGLQLDGQNMLAGVWDGGKVRADHVEFGDRVTRWDNTAAAYAAHSTHVMGTILSSGVNNSGSKGMASKASGMYSDWTNDMKEMADAVLEKSLLVSNHSYGLKASSSTPVSIFGAYSKDAADMDKLLFASPYYQPVWAAGNDRDSGFNSTKNGYDLLTEAGVCKNVVVVAAVEEVLDYTSASSVKMSSFSNWGPTDDNRIKPDISTKGVGVFSTSVNPKNTSDTTFYETMQGTSMASPGVAGTLLLLQQHYNNVNGVFMRSATLRGIMAHTADEAGTAAGPDPRFGWGLINAERAAKAITDAKAEIPKAIVSELTLNQGQTYSTQVYASGNETLVATISWTDKEGIADVAADALVNDLDIRITKDGVTSYPWRLHPTNNKAALRNADNKVDNIEKIEVEGTVAGVYTITVSHKPTAILEGGLQNFSLIVTGIDQQKLGFEKSDFKEFNVWPNPVNDLLNVSIQSDLSSDAYVTLYDIQGRRVVDQKLNASDAMFEGSLNIGSLSSGIYVVKVSQGNKQSIRKIVKK